MLSIGHHLIVNFFSFSFGQLLPLKDSLNYDDKNVFFCFMSANLLVEQCFILEMKYNNSGSEMPAGTRLTTLKS